jgi:hypothetical protein
MTDLDNLQSLADRLHADHLGLMADAAEDRGLTYLAAAYREMAAANRWPALVLSPAAPAPAASDDTGPLAKALAALALPPLPAVRWEWWRMKGERLFAASVPEDMLRALRVRARTPGGQSVGAATCGEALRLLGETCWP